MHIIQTAANLQAGEEGKVTGFLFACLHKGIPQIIPEKKPTKNVITLNIKIKHIKTKLEHWR